MKHTPSICESKQVSLSAPAETPTNDRENIARVYTVPHKRRIPSGGWQTPRLKSLAIGTAIMLGGGTAAMAQSSITLFGIVDAGITYGKNSGGDSTHGLSTSGNASSRLGFRGVEDLGGGLKAGFWLEGAIQNDDGSGKGAGAAGPGFEFKRRSTVSLLGNFGEIRLGRGLTRAYDDVSRYDVFGQVGVGQNHIWGNALGAQSRMGNMVTLISPSFGGIKGSLDVAFGEKGDTSKQNYYGGSLTYDAGPLSAALGAEKWEKPTFKVADKDTNFDSHSSYGIGASYKLDAFKISAFVREQSNKPLTGKTQKINAAHLGLTWQIGAGEARVAYNRYDNKDVNGKAQQFSLGYVHNLSKRTSLYTTYAYLKNDKKEAFALKTGGLDFPKLTPGKTQSGLTAGITHRF